MDREKYQARNKKIAIISVSILAAYIIFLLVFNYYYKRNPQDLPWIYRMYRKYYIIRIYFMKHMAYLTLAVLSISLLNMMSVLKPYEKMNENVKRIALIVFILAATAMEFYVLGILPRRNLYLMNIIINHGEFIIFIIGLVVTFLCTDCQYSAHEEPHI